MRSGNGKASVEVLRGGAVESIHLVSVVAVSLTGKVLVWMGVPERRIYWRSAAKPFQAWAMVDAGAADALGLHDADLAIACASHGGEPCHLKAASHLLEQAGLEPEDLRCGSHPPLYPPAAADLVRQGIPPGPLHNNCSGNHAGMLALTRHLGGSVADYLDPGGPAQTAILAAIARHAGQQAGSIRQAVDGCSAPTYLLPLFSL
ncbi:MAG: asparaginase, partial [Acidobacteriota bacterium]